MRDGLFVFAGFALLSVTYVGYGEFQRSRDIASASAAVQQIADQGRSAPVWSAQPDPRVAAERAQARRGRPLGGDERCVGGRVVVARGSEYTGTGLVCSGSMVLP